MHSMEPKLYVRVPHGPEHANKLIYFVDTVWNLPRPKLLIGITGGATDFPCTTELENVLNELMVIARLNDAWIITGGTSCGIMKYIGNQSVLNWIAQHW